MGSEILTFLFVGVGGKGTVIYRLFLLYISACYLSVFICCV